MKAVILLSGGIDSTVLMYRLVATNIEVYPLTIDYGQRHYKEITAARKVCQLKSKELYRRWKLVRLPVRTLLPSALTGTSEVPSGEYTEESLQQTVVPNRNMILLSLAAGYAMGIGAKRVAYAAHGGDHSIYPDCRPEFVASMAKAVSLGTGKQVELVAPFVFLTKEEIIKHGVTHHVPFDTCYSCYKGGDLHCGVCSTCHERREAFISAGVEDPTTYERN